MFNIMGVSLVVMFFSPFEAMEGVIKVDVWTTSGFGRTVDCL